MTHSGNPNADPNIMYRPAVTPEEWAKREASRGDATVQRTDGGAVRVAAAAAIGAAVTAIDHVDIPPVANRALVAFLVAGAAWWPSDRHLNALEKVAGGFEPTADEKHLLEELTVMLQSLTRGA